MKRTKIIYVIYIFFIFLRVQPSTRPSRRLNVMAFCPKHPKWDQNPKFSYTRRRAPPPLSLSYASSPPTQPPPPGHVEETYLKSYEWLRTKTRVHPVATKFSLRISYNNNRYLSLGMDLNRADTIIHGFNLKQNCIFWIDKTTIKQFAQ